MPGAVSAGNRDDPMIPRGWYWGESYITSWLPRSGQAYATPPQTPCHPPLPPVTLAQVTVLHKSAGIGL